MKDGHLHLGIDLGGTEIKAVVLGDDAQVRWSRQIETRSGEGRAAVLERMVHLVAAASDAVSPRHLAALGVAIPGVVDPEAGRIELLTNLTADWNGFGVRAALEGATGLGVSLLNDVRAATLAEHLVGAGRGYSSFICVAVGTGVGGGLVLDNTLFLGSRGAAGEIGHITVAPDGRSCNCGNVGCLETEASGPAIVRAGCAAIEAGDGELAELAGSRHPSSLQIARAAERGSSTACAIFAHAGVMLGRALGGLVCVLNPQAIVVGGGVAKAGDLLLDPLRAEITRRTVVFTPARGGIEVLRSSLDGRAGAIGAAAWSIRSGRIPWCDGMSEGADMSLPPALRYVEAVRHTLDQIVETQLERVREASDLCAEIILKGGLVHLFGSGHSRMAVEEMYPRYGSFPGFHPLVELSLSNHHQVVGNNGQRQAMFVENAEGLGKIILGNFRFNPELDVMMVISAGGTNSVPVEVAIEAKRLQLPVIAITSVEHSRLSTARHSSGKRLFEVADLVIDTCTPPGDAAVHVPDLDTPVGPLTTIACATVINMMKSEVAARLTEAGKPPNVLTSSVLVGRERSETLFDASYDEFRERTRRL